MKYTQWSYNKIQRCQRGQYTYIQVPNTGFLLFWHMMTSAKARHIFQEACLEHHWFDRWRGKRGAGV
jgi:hypothetical protein